MSKKDRKKNLRIAFSLLIMAGIVGGCGVYQMYEEYRVLFHVVGIGFSILFVLVIINGIFSFFRRDSLSKNRKDTKVATEVGMKYLERRYKMHFDTEVSMPGSRRRFDLFGQKNGLLVVGEVKTTLQDASKLCAQLMTYHNILRGKSSDKIWYVIMSSNVVDDIDKKEDGLLDALQQLRLGRKRVNILVVDTDKRKAHTLAN